jgi:diguanylate cyclase (GGDEF)-like protein
MPKRRQVVPRNAADTIRVQSSLGSAIHGTARRVATLVVVQGAEVDLGRHVLCDHPITIGRDEAAQLALCDGSISRQHCRVERDSESGRYVLVDLGSTNGTVINGTKIDRKVPLASGDKIFLGASVVRFSYADDVDLEYQSRVEELVSTDPLTGLTVRREYDPAYQALVEQARADGKPLTVMVLDVDGLKQINDTHGHDMGCHTIVEMSFILRDVLQDHGLLCRFGGDEFVACLPEIDRERARELAEDVRDRVARHNFVKDGIRVEPTISIGVAGFPVDAQTPAGLFANADKAMYASKRAGKNQVTLWDPRKASAS